MKQSVKIIMLVASLLFVMGLWQATAQTTVKAGATLTQVYSSTLFYEGPTWDPVTKKLYFTTPNDSPYNVYRLDGIGQASIWMANSQRINGTFLTADGRLLTAEQGAPQRICSYRIGVNGPEDQKVLASDALWYYPNDLCLRKQGGEIYFSSVNWENRPCGVYRIKDGAVTQVISDMGRPNGVETSLDGTKLYVSDSMQKNWKVYPISADGNLSSGSVFFSPSTSNQNDPDGMTIDERGNLYFTGRGGLWIVSPTGTQLDFISVLEATSNVTFGGTEGMTLYITCRNKVYSLETTVHGAYWQSTTPTPTPTATPTPQGLKGDVNKSGKVDVIDALLVAQYSAGMAPANFTASLADVNCSGTIDVVDALLIARYSGGLLLAFPCQ